LENNVFVGSHSFIGGKVRIGHHSVIAAGTILIADGLIIPPYSLVIGNPYKVKEGYYENKNTRMSSL
jgi:acetyltransferase-like isoleucine patch superfamily enzyme